MNLLTLIHEQLLDYTKQLKEVESEIVRKYKSGEDYSNELQKAKELKVMQEECIKMMANKSNTNQ